MYFYKSKDTKKFYYNNLINQDEYNHKPTNDNAYKYDSILPYYTITSFYIKGVRCDICCVLGECINGYPLFIKSSNIFKAFVDNDENIIFIGDITKTTKRLVAKKLQKYMPFARLVIL